VPTVSRHRVIDRSRGTSQRDHLYAKEVGLPVHVPGEPVSLLPSPACPLMVGGCVLLGAAMVASCVLLGAAIVAGCVLLGAAIVTARVSHHLRVPWSGSPKTVLLQSTPPVNVRGAVKVPFAP
jgi:hypothetical protein